MSIKERDFLLGFVIMLLLVGCLLGFYFNTYSKENKADIITAIASVVGVLVSSVAIYYVYGTYHTQQEELKDNRKNTELNRNIDILYRHAEIHRSKYDKDVETLNKLLPDIFWVDDYLQYFEYFDRLTILLQQDLEFHRELQETNLFTTKEKKFLRSIAYSFLPREISFTIIGLTGVLINDNKRFDFSAKVQAHAAKNKIDNGGNEKEFANKRFDCLKLYYDLYEFYTN